MNKLAAKLLLQIAVVVCLFCFAPARADWQPYTWLINIETEEIPRQFQYAGSGLRPVVLARVNYARADGSDAVPYETLWFCNNRPFGLERFGPLNIQQGQSVTIKVTYKTKLPSDSDYRAAAKAIVRVFLDVRVNNSMLQSVIVPDDSFTTIVSEMNNDHFAAFNTPIETPYQIAAPIFLQDESDRQTQTLCYAPQSPGY